MNIPKVYCDIIDKKKKYEINELLLFEKFRKDVAISCNINKNIENKNWDIMKYGFYSIGTYPLNDGSSYVVITSARYMKSKWKIITIIKNCNNKYINKKTIIISNKEFYFALNKIGIGTKTKYAVIPASIYRAIWHRHGHILTRYHVGFNFRPSTVLSVDPTN